MRYEVYRHKSVSDTEFTESLDFYKQVEAEDKWLANGAQGNLNSDTYVAGPLHPELEEGVSYCEKLISDMVTKHAEMEKAAGHQIWPARRVIDSKNVQEKEQFCQDMCGDEKLGWQSK